jgi:hypothetical protein
MNPRLLFTEKSITGALALPGEGLTGQGNRIWILNCRQEQL